MKDKDTTVVTLHPVGATPAKYKIRLMSDGRYRIFVRPEHSENWVNASETSFLTHVEGVQAIQRIVKDEHWLYDANGDPL